MRDEGLSSGRLWGVNWTFAGIFSLLLLTAVSIVPVTVTLYHLGASHASVIDVAGQQRMLLERYIKEVLLAAQGFPAPYEKTGTLLNQRVTALISGGPAPAKSEPDGMFVLPPAPTDEIRSSLLEQQHLLAQFMVEADAFLRTSPSADDFALRRQAVLASNAVLLQVSNDAVTMLTRYSEGQVRAVIRWELIVVALVVALASTRTWRLLQVENALRQSQAATMQALQQSDAVKSSLLSSVSHELRTPLTAIKAMLFSLQESSPAQQNGHRECLKDIDEEVDYLNRLVDNLLDMSRLEAGVLAPNREWNLVEELAEAAIRRLGRRLECRPLHIDLPGTLPPVYVDGVAIQQVLVNLLDNAVKFSPRDTPIWLQARPTGEEVEVSVRNEGPGIPMHELERIFDRFYRLTAPTSAIQGTGLGLAICKGIIEAHGGRIEARSIPGKETSIRFYLPLVKDMPGNRLHTMQEKAG